MACSPDHGRKIANADLSKAYNDLAHQIYCTSNKVIIIEDMNTLNALRYGEAQDQAAQMKMDSFAHRLTVRYKELQKSECCESVHQERKEAIKIASKHFQMGPFSEAEKEENKQLSKFEEEHLAEGKEILRDAQWRMRTLEAVIEKGWVN